MEGLRWLRNSWPRDSTAGFAFLGLSLLLGQHNPDLAQKAFLAGLSLSLFGLFLTFVVVASLQPTREALATGSMRDPQGAFAHDYFHVKRHRNSFAFALAFCVYILLDTLSKNTFSIAALVPWLLIPIALILLIVLFRKQLVFGLLLVVKPLFYWLMYGMAVAILLTGEASTTVPAVLFVIALVTDEWLLAVLAVWAPDIRQILSW